MTQRKSVKGFLGQMLSVFKWELNKNRTALIIFGVLAAFFTIIIYALCATTPEQQGLEIFQFIATAVVFLMTSVYTIVYTIKVFSYLHNKRQADMYMQLPIKSEAMFLSKGASAFIFSVIPALFFIGIICLITAVSGNQVSGEILRFFLKIPLGALACISFYGLLAVCCGTSVNTVVSFALINFAYPLSSMLVKAMVDSFFKGVPTFITPDFFLLKAFNPLAAYDGINIIYWLIFTAVCAVSGAFLTRRRKNELAQTAYVYKLPCHAVKLLTAFIAGMLIGLVFGGANVLNNSYAGFVFGFLLGSSAAFVITHVILFRNFQKFVKSLIYYGALCVLTLVFAAVCDFASPAYRSFVPDAEDVKSAGFVFLADLGDGSGQTAPQIAKDAAEDFSGEKEINDIISSHKEITGESDYYYFGGNSPYSLAMTGAWKYLVNYVDGTSVCIAYTMNDGSVKTRVYTDYYTECAVTKTAAYFEKYNIINRVDVSKLEAFSVINENNSHITVKNTEKYKADEVKTKILEAFRADYRENPVDLYEYYDFNLLIGFNYDGGVYKKYEGRLAFAGSLFTGISTSEYNSIMPSNFSTDYTMMVPKNYNRTIKTLKEFGLIDESGELNQNSEFGYVKGLYY